MKAFTDINQSKKLAKILPIESADMCWVTGEIEPLWGVIKSEPDDDFDVIPSWSLAALLNLLPSVITRNEKRMFLTLEKAGAYNLYYKSPDRLDELWETKEDAIDACVEMIVKLKEKDLI